MNYAVPVYNPVSISNLPNFTITNSQFLEFLLCQIQGETIKFSAMLKKHFGKKIVHWLKKLSFWRSKIM